VVLFASGTEADWPDELDLTTGSFAYYGDNRHPGNELHDSPGEGGIFLQQAFDLAHGDADARRIGTASRGGLPTCSPVIPWPPTAHYRGGGGSPDATT
jgi:hypothetical protein